MVVKVNLEQMLPLMIEVLESGSEFSFNPRGISMMPLLHMDGDRVIIKKPEGQLKKYDIPLYRRQNGQFVLHRIVKKPRNFTYTLCGDNQRRLEKGIRQEQIIGVVTGFYRKGKFISCRNKLYKLYSFLWVNTRPLGFIIMKIYYKIFSGREKQYEKD